MDIKDFEGITKYKVIVPTLYAISWICMIIGPIFFDVVYERICLVFVLYADIKTMLFFVIMIIITIKSQKIFKRASNQMSVDLSNR